MNQQFLDRMKQYLQDDYNAYIETLDAPMYRGIRINETKCTQEELEQLALCELTPSSICPQSFYIPETVEKLGNHPAHLAGLFYMQEPSASSAVEVLDVAQGDWVLDLCAAPGGKSTQIAAKLAHTGFLVSNEIEGKRAQILLSNMERLGFGECMITNSHPDILCKELSGWFDKVLVDAPCSGEGMFKKHSKAMDDWSVAHVEACAQRQQNILESAYEALKQEGILVYSTCTYSMEENEQVIDTFLQRHPDMELVDPGVTFGRGGIPYGSLDVTQVRRILPMDHGEGHFVAKMIKHGEAKKAKVTVLPTAQLPHYVTSFLKDQLSSLPKYAMQLQDKVYVKQSPFLQLKKTRIIRQGILVGELTKQRIEPHQHFYTAGQLAPFFNRQYDVSEEECRLYLQGNQLAVQGYKGYTLITWHHHPIAFAKGDGTVLKNKYPKGMRLHA